MSDPNINEPTDADGVTVPDIVRLLTKNNDEISPQTAKDIAEKVKWVIEKLGIEDFINLHWWDKLYDKLVDCEKYASKVSMGGDILFVNMAIPLVNGIIHVGSSRDKLIKTTEGLANFWKADGLPEPEKVPIVSTLTLIYLVAKGLDEPTDIAPPDAREKFDKNKDLWKHMQTRVQHLSSAPD